ncbi:DUF3597 family protein [Erythrobacter arachoides]|uniref:DUF3597 family protein n=1 Tax=Aurantiacibacter arachoides TaxID=1850444 RepID=A0A845A2B7_9SPHN|nr:DUF3597 domain-containing protein [Aurantiacibacter arachoides]MXO93097.1 DUF3597 family protein [Aurantiacibacter arachoides]GGD52069.1 hypothetical protein GCM10011411_09880 [Aurantiacibacter arachoides]
MSIFTSIKNAIFGRKDETPAPTTAGTAAGTTAGKTMAPAQTKGFGAGKSAAVDEVDVERRLDGMGGADNLNWRSSIVDLMKLVGLDPSYENRKELATELGDADYSGKAEENIWLHRQVMNKLAANGGRVPADLRD